MQKSADICNFSALSGHFLSGSDIRYGIRLIANKKHRT
jgi:hypothetical protein